MDWLPTVVVALISAGAAILAAYFVFRRRGQELELTAEEQETRRRDNKAAIDERIDARVELQLEKAWQRIDVLEEQVNDLREGQAEQQATISTQSDRITEQDRIMAKQTKEIETLNGSALNVKEIVRRWFKVLRLWDTDGRRGELPLPAPDDIVLLELDTEP